jgi:hypothetical protein
MDAVCSFMDKRYARISVTGDEYGVQLLRAFCCGFWQIS